jgi:beta-glucanase (GH16 family)
MLPPLPDNDTTAAPERDGFTLLFEDHFDTLDTTRWQTASHTFTENAAQFDPSMVTIEDGFLRLGLEAAPSPSAEGREYRGGELRTIDFFGYGRFEARIRFAPGSGVVSSLFTYYDHWADPALPENWNEIDIEFLGKDPTHVQFNVIHWNAANQRTTHEQHAATAFDPSAEFHDYAIEWLPNVVNFYIDEELVHSQTDQIAEFLTLDSRLMMNVWPVQNTPNLTAWAGTFGPESAPTAAYYDWVRVYAHTP